MKPKKSARLAKRDKTWQQSIEKRLKLENVKLGHPQGKERFKQLLKNSLNKKT